MAKIGDLVIADIIGANESSPLTMALGVLVAEEKYTKVLTILSQSGKRHRCNNPTVIPDNTMSAKTKEFVEKIRQKLADKKELEIAALNFQIIIATDQKQLVPYLYQVLSRMIRNMMEKDINIEKSVFRKSIEYIPEGLSEKDWNEIKKEELGTVKIL